MLKLLMRTGLLVSGLLITLACLYRRAAQYGDTGYLAAIADKHHRADAFSNQPRLLLAGGSATAFSLDSQILEDSLRLPVVNLAMHAGLGLPFMLRQVESVARPGDVVLLTPEYFLGNGDDYTQFYTSELYGPAEAYMTFEGPLNYLVRRATYCLKRVQTSLFLGKDDQRSATIRDTTSVYFRAGFSVRGDLISPLNNQRPASVGRLQITSCSYAREIALINATAARLRRHGITMLVTYPALAKTEFVANKTAIDQYVSRLKQLRSVQLVGRPEWGTYADSCFFDTPYHLYGRTRQAHSQQLVRHLRAANLNQADLHPVASLR